MTSTEKLKTILNFTDKITIAHRFETERLLKKIETTRSLTLIEEMSIDSIIDIYDIK